MESPLRNAGPLAETSKRFLHRLSTIGENRLELLMVEVQEERERLLRAILLALGAAAFGLLTVMALTATIVVLVPGAWRVGAMVALTGLYGVATACLYRRFSRLLRDWQTLPATIDQLQKDCACLEKHLT